MYKQKTKGIKKAGLYFAEIGWAAWQVGSCIGVFEGAIKGISGLENLMR